jgi:hypothetical protein
MSIINKQVSVEQTRVDNIADESIQHIDTMKTIDGGDHQINIWINEAGQRRISIQGTGENVTVLTVAV